MLLTCDVHCCVSVQEKAIKNSIKKERKKERKIDRYAGPVNDCAKSRQHCCYNVALTEL